MVHKTQSRLISYGHGTYFTGGNPPMKAVPSLLGSTGECITFDHPNRKLGGGDVGGPFYSCQTWYKSQDNDVTCVGLGRWYEGTLHTSWWPQGVVGSMSLQQKPDNFLSLVAAGATAISRTIPTNPISGAAIAVGEAREGFPRFIGSTLLKRTRDLRSVGDEYLNVEFGWKPMVADLLSFGRAVKESNKMIRQLHRDSGVNNSVRRKYHFPIEKSESDPGAPFSPWVHPYFCDGTQPDAWMIDDGPQPTGFTNQYITETKTWFSGAYSYVVPTAPVDLWDKMDMWDAEANKLFGTRITPAVLWELAPWSWAADWFGNTGDILTNISALSHDSLVLKYGYVMRETQNFTRTTWQGYLAQHDRSHPRYVKIQEDFGSTQKVRIRATPFGFGIDFDGLSAKQIAIAAAVGTTQSPRLSL